MTYLYEKNNLSKFQVLIIIFLRLSCTTQEIEKAYQKSIRIEKLNRINQ